jgi:hypothetical protein
MDNKWSVQINDLVGGYVVTDYPHPLSAHDHSAGGDPTKRGCVIATCMTEWEAQCIANALNSVGPMPNGVRIQRDRARPGWWNPMSQWAQRDVS